MKSTSAIHPTIKEDSLVKHGPHISMRESHNCNIKLILLHYTVVIRSVSAIFVSFTEVIICTNCESSPICSCEERMGAQKGSKVAPWCKHCSCCNWSKGTYLGLETALCESMVPVYYLQAVFIGTHPQITTRFESLELTQRRQLSFQACSRCLMFI